MNYETAKRLKNAKFPGMENRGWNGIFIYPKSPSLTEEGNLITHGDPVPVPTLSELIEACGDSLERLERGAAWDDGDEVTWVAYMSENAFDKYQSGLDVQYACSEIGCCGYESGSTPEEAVAYLWLALNGKDA